MCSFYEEELSCESTGEEKADTEVDCRSTKAACLDTDTRDGYRCYEEGDGDDVTGIDEGTYP